MKKISVVIPCYYEEKSVRLMYERLMKVFKNELSNYDYEIIYVDDYSKDNTRPEIEKICNEDHKVKAIFNAKNYGYTRSVYYSLLQGNGDAVFMIFGDLQDPPELLPEFVKKWENGDKVILGQKVSSDENQIVFFLRTLYYKLMKKFSSVQQVQHYNSFGLYDKQFIQIARKIDDPMPYLKGIVGEFGMNQSIIQYKQSRGQRGKSNVNFARAYDAAMIGITSYTKTLMRVSTFIGIITGIISIIIAFVTFILKLRNWDTFQYGTAAIVIGVFFIGAVQLFFTGILGEYILSINTRVLKRPLVVPERKINFDDEQK